MQVAGLALENGANEDEAIATLLHDVMEDQDVTQEERITFCSDTFCLQGHRRL